VKDFDPHRQANNTRFGLAAEPRRAESPACTTVLGRRRAGRHHWNKPTTASLERTVAASGCPATTAERLFTPPIIAPIR